MKNRIFSLLVLVALACACKGVRYVNPKDFDASIDGAPVSLYTLRAGDISLQVTNFGARVVSLYTPDRSGRYCSIVVGHRTLQEYITPPGERFFGACVGPVANRIGGAGFDIDGVHYDTPANDNEVNTLHGGYQGLDNVVWEVVSVCDSAIVFHYQRPDMDEGYPGNLDIDMTYALTSDDVFRVSYSAVTDQTTPVNLSHHSFFCLRGEGTGSVEDYLMQINASAYIPIDSLSIPTGEIAPVEGTPFDFRQPHRIGERIGEDNLQLHNARGYDHNWCLDVPEACGSCEAVCPEAGAKVCRSGKACGSCEAVCPEAGSKVCRSGKACPRDGLFEACRVSDPVSGRYVEVWTDQPGIQFYSGNFFAGTEKGANGRTLAFRSSLALETQKYPDSVNQPGFTPVLLHPGEEYTHICEYHFGVTAE